MSKAKELLNNFYSESSGKKNIQEYSWSNPIDSVYVDRDNDVDIDSVDDIDNVDTEIECDCVNDSTCDKCYPQDANTIIPFDDVDNKRDLVSTPFPNLHYDNMSKYYSQELIKPDFLTSKSCQMCADNEKMHGVRYCRPCYDKLRYRRRKILNAPFNTLVPFNTNNTY